MNKNICTIDNKNNKYSCFNMISLKKIAGKLNKDTRYKNYKKIDVKKYNKNNKKKLVNEIQRKLNCNNHLDFCIIEKEDNFLNEIIKTIKPKGPIDIKEWLSSLDIENVMKKYEKKYKNFNFMGPYPMDFEYIFIELGNLNLKKLTKKHKKIGIVFNTDTSDGPGEHWISLFLDLENKTVCFFDSAGDKPPTPVLRLIKKIKTQAKKMNINIKIIINEKQFQYDDSSCGIWSLYHIISRLNGKSCDYIYNSNVSDKLMYKKRKEYFRK